VDVVPIRGGLDDDVVDLAYAALTAERSVHEISSLSRAYQNVIRAILRW
jgi:hypothetical protein